MNALVTGGAGFIGSHLVDALLKRGDSVCVIDDLSTGSRDNLVRSSENGRFRLEVGRVEDVSTLEALLQDADVVFHMAAVVGVRLVIKNRVRTMRANLHGTDAVLELAARYGTKVFLASSSEVYGPSDAVPFAEDQPLRLGSPDVGRWGYASSKATGEFLALAYAKEQGLPLVIGRLFNTSGPRQTAEFGMVLPTFVRQALKGEPVTVFGDGAQTRCFAHVDDVVRAILALMDHPNASGEIFNVGHDNEITMGELARKVITLADSTSSVVYVPYEDVWPDFDEMRRRVPDLSKIRSTIDLGPTKGIEEVICSVIEYARRRAGP